MSRIFAHIVAAAVVVGQGAKQLISGSIGIRQHSSVVGAMVLGYDFPSITDKIEKIIKMVKNIATTFILDEYGRSLL